MANNKHLSLSDRITIESMLEKHHTFKEIGSFLDKDPTTISKEIRSRFVTLRTGGRYIQYNNCQLRFSCSKKHLCHPCHSSRKFKLCRNCSMCNAFCDEFIPDTCPKHSKPPYVCNGCGKRYTCSLEKHLYIAKDAHSRYRTLLSESRTGISFSEEEIKHLDDLITPLIKKGQSPHHICATNRDSIMVSERTIYRFVDSRIFSAMNLDLPRKVRYSARKKAVHVKVDKACRINRTYEDFKTFMHSHPDYPLVELDSVEGKRGSKVLLTIHFVKAEFMLAFLREHNDSKSVIDIFDFLYSVLKPELFKSIFKVCLTDNGSEFSNPLALEFNSSQKRRTHIFYCDASAPYQKGSAERNHEFIRFFIPKGTDIGNYSQDDINLMMDHINSYCRESLGNKSPYEMFSFLYGQDCLDLLGCHLIPPNKVTLNRSIFCKEGAHETR